VQRPDEESQGEETRVLIEVLPEPFGAAAAALDTGDLLEIVMDLGRPAEARLPGRVARLGDGMVER
jgi:stage III sporulation protein SpoIIIAA